MRILAWLHSWTAFPQCLSTEEQKCGMCAQWNTIKTKDEIFHLRSNEWNWIMLLNVINQAPRGKYSTASLKMFNVVCVSSLNLDIECWLIVMGKRVCEGEMGKGRSLLTNLQLNRRNSFCCSIHSIIMRCTKWYASLFTAERGLMFLPLRFDNNLRFEQYAKCICN